MTAGCTNIDLEVTADPDMIAKRVLPAYDGFDLQSMPEVLGEYPLGGIVE